MKLMHPYACKKMIIIIMALLLLCGGQSAMAKMKEGYTPTSWTTDPFFKPTADGIPNTQNCSHRVGNVFLTITNWGFFGSKFWQDQLREEYCTYGDEPLGMLAPSFEFPAGSGVNYLFQGALWFAAIIEDDTLCSVGADGWQWVNEMYPAAIPDGGLVQKSIRKGSVNYDPDAISEQDFYAVYTDTLTNQQYVTPDPIEGRPHKPINIEVNQRSYSWSYKYAEDFILIDFMLRNIGQKSIRRGYMGLYIDADIWAGPTDFVEAGYEDDYSGFKVSVPSPAGGGLEDTINIAWTADDDGDPHGGAFYQKSPTGVAGTRVVRSPNPELQYSFNWWNSNGYNTNFDWGPMKSANYRDFGTGGLGTPETDRNKYYILSNNEFDYDQLFAAVDYSDQGWLPPPTPDLAENIADGFDTRYLFSFGPFNIEPGDSLLVTCAYVAGADFHVKPEDKAVHFDAQNPQVFYEKLDFTDLGINSTWAAWMYDNPGVDTDGDGDSGKFRIRIDTIIENFDTTFVENRVYYEGDGVPDFKGPPPPPSPNLRYSAIPGRVTLKWNGLQTETYIDDFSQKQDFEGYRVYFGQELKTDAFALLTSHDLVDFNRHIWDAGKQKWFLRDTPFSLDDLRAMYGDDFDPLMYTEEDPFEYDGELFYFERVDWNQYFSDPRGIKKTFMDEILSGAVTSDTGYLEYPDNYYQDDDSIYHKYYEYEYTISELRESDDLFFSVTAFDFGNPENGLEPLESSPLSNAIRIFPIYSADQVVENDAKVSVYPNPYVGDGAYRADGYESKEGDRERERRIHFVNLPEECTIKIWTTDGDLVREIKHEFGNPNSETNSKAYWDLITRNTQAAVSGLYIYTIESDLGTQVGKIVIIK